MMVVGEVLDLEVHQVQVQDHIVHQEALMAQVAQDLVQVVAQDLEVHQDHHQVQVVHLMDLAVHQDLDIINTKNLIK